MLSIQSLGLVIWLNKIDGGSSRLPNQNITNGLNFLKLRPHDALQATQQWGCAFLFLLYCVAWEKLAFTGRFIAILLFWAVAEPLSLQLFIVHCKRALAVANMDLHCGMKVVGAVAMFSSLSFPLEVCASTTSKWCTICCSVMWWCRA